MTHSIENVSNILRTDSYKPSHWLQYPPGTSNIFSYFTARDRSIKEMSIVGLNYYLKRYLSVPITMADVDYAEKRMKEHFGSDRIFNRAGWERIVTVHGGFIPVRIRAVPEGTVLPSHNVIMTVENTDPQLPWVTNYVETLLTKLWYPITVATKSREIKKLIKKYLERTGTVEALPFKLHDFGYRGVSSEESAAIGGFAHLVNFQGTDTMIALEMATDFYRATMAGYSVPAAEHSTIILWGETKEYEAFDNMIQQFGTLPFYAVVSDSYDIHDACERLWGDMLKQKVLNAPGTLVVRPDSGIPHKVVKEVVEILGHKFGYTTNDKGFKVLNRVRVIQGDGIDHDEISKILFTLELAGWSADNVTFGMGGALLQKMNRDTYSFAFKASSAVINGTVRDVFKAPKTDGSKASFCGRMKLIQTDDGEFDTVNVHTIGQDILETVWENGTLLVDPSLDDIRQRSAV